MHRLLALPLAAVIVKLHAAPLPSREQIFAPMSPRPAISSSGKWIASTGIGPTAVRISPLRALGTPVDVALPPGTRLYWYRWARDGADTLIVSAGDAERDDIYRVDPITGSATRVTGANHDKAMSFGHHANNYAFTYARFRHKVDGTSLDMDPNGALVPASSGSGHLPAYLADGTRSLKIKAAPDGWKISAGSVATPEAALRVSHGDTRTGGLLASITTDGKVYALSSEQSDLLALVELDTASGIRKLVAQGSADISKVHLNPADLRPDAVEFETNEPTLKLLNDGIAPDIKALMAKGAGFPSILDRSPNDRYWVVKYAHRDGTPQMVSYDRKTRKTTPLPHAIFPALDSPDWRVRPFALERTEGPAVGGYVALPRAGVCEKKRCPAVLMVHGGPGVRDHAAFDAQRFLLTSRGIAVITVNFRGSSGFGKKFQSLDARQWDKGIPQDVNDSLQHVLARFPIDPERVAGMGGSFSGHLLLNMAARGTRLRCAVIGFTSTDIVKFADRRFAKFGEGSDILQRVGDSRIPAEKAAMLAMSPVSHIQALASLPLLHFHGRKDENTYMDDNLEFVDLMGKANPQYTFVDLPLDGHGPTVSRDEYHALSEQFLGHCLGVATEPPGAALKKRIAEMDISGNRSFIQP